MKIFVQKAFWRQLAGVPENQGYVVYGGEQPIQTNSGSLNSWREPERIPDL